MAASIGDLKGGGQPEMFPGPDSRATIGSFADEHTATTLADYLARRYRTAKVLHFNSPVGDWWVRVRVLNDDRRRAQQLVSETHTSQGSVFLVRLD